ncbi:hypothetical protein ABBQ32_013140 [Trebouxia sp. C0010 RCD-2024]
MSEVEDSKEQEEATEKPSSEPEPVLSATSAPREDQVQNAVTFLSHPKVRGSTTDSKRSFLQKKGLTEAEIADAFKRVPETSDTSVGTAAATYSTTGQLAQITRPQKPFPTAAPVSGQYQPAYGQSQALQPQQAVQPAGYRWSQVALGAGLVAVTAWGVKALVFPYAVQAYRSWTGKPDPAAEKQQRELEIGKMLSDAFTAQTAELKATVKSLEDMVGRMEQGRKGADMQDGLTLSELRQELRSFSATLTDFSSGPAASPKSAETGGVRRELAEIKSLLGTMATSGNSPLLTNGYRRAPNAGDASSVSRQLPFGSNLQPSQTAASSPVSFKSGSNSPQAQRQLVSPFQTNGGSDHLLETTPEVSPGEPPHPNAYMSILDMLQKGEQPPGIQDIDDKPPNPDQAISEPKMKPRPKPWERTAQSGEAAKGQSSFFAEGAASPGASASNAGSSSRVQITELASTPDQGNTPTAQGAPAPWRPPPVPQSSINLNKHVKSESSSST